jgi:FtsX-like permease family
LPKAYKNTISFDLRQPPPPFVYVPYFDGPKNARQATIEILAEGSLASITDAVRRELHNRLPDAALTVLPFTKLVENSLVQERLVELLASFFGFLALGLPAVGLYGLMAYYVVQRTSEIGIRMALGATRVNVLGLVLRSAFGMVAAGVVASLPLAFAGSTSFRRCCSECGRQIRLQSPPQQFFFSYSELLRLISLHSELPRSIQMWPYAMNSGVTHEALKHLTAITEITNDDST